MPHGQHLESALGDIRGRRSTCSVAPVVRGGPPVPMSPVPMSKPRGLRRLALALAALMPLLGFLLLQQRSEAGLTPVASVGYCWDGSPALRPDGHGGLIR